VKISIVLPYYNDSKFLSGSIQSVLNQTYKDFELILINHGSTDNSEKIVKSFSDSRIKHIKIARNYGGGGSYLG
jgi:glycosyltransferase involved in cell wall biosynthesis